MASSRHNYGFNSLYQAVLNICPLVFHLKKTEQNKTPPPPPPKTIILGQAYDSFGHNSDSGFSGFII